MEENRSRRQVPGRRDPFVNDHARRRAVINQAAEKLHRERISEWDRPSEAERAMKLHRQRYTFLMFLFLGLAVAVYTGTNLMSPKLRVTLSEGEGIVVVDGQERGRTGTTLRNVKPGERHVTVIPDDPRLILTEQEQVVEVEWSIAPADLHFYVIHAQQPPTENGGAVEE